MAPVLSSTPEFGELSVSRPGSYTSGKEPRYQPNRRLVRGPKDGMEVWGEKMFAMFRDCHYSEYATPNPNLNK
jgi:hypothetical protein